MNDRSLARLAQVRRLRVVRAQEALAASRAARDGAAAALGAAEARLEALRDERMRLDAAALAAPDVCMLQRREQRRTWFDEQIPAALEDVRLAAQALDAADAAHRAALSRWRAAVARADALEARARTLRQNASRHAGRVQERALEERTVGGRR